MNLPLPKMMFLLEYSNVVGIYFHYLYICTRYIFKGAAKMCSNLFQHIDPSMVLEFCAHPSPPSYTIEKSSGGKKEEIRAASYNHEFCFDCVNRVGKIHAVK